MNIWGKKTDVKDRNFQNFRQGIKTLWELIGSEKKRVVITVFMLLFLEACAISFQYLIKIIFDMVQKIEKGQGNKTVLLWLLGGMFVFKQIDRALTNKGQQPFLIRVVIKLENWWPVLVQEKLLSLPASYHEREGVGDMGEKIEKIRKGCDKCMELLSSFFWWFLPHVLYFSMNIIVITAIDWQLGLVFFLPFIPAMLIQIIGTKRFDPTWEEYEKKKEIATGIMYDSLINYGTVQSCGQEAREKNRHSAVRGEMAEIDLQVSLRKQNYDWAMFAISDAAFCLAFAACAILIVFSHRGTMGTLAYISATGMIIANNFWEAMSHYTKIARDIVAVRRMKAILDEPSENLDAPDAIAPKEIKGDIVLKDVSFAYPGKDAPAVSGINMIIPAGRTVAIVGASGGGKTTLLNLINGTHWLKEGQGEITFGGYPLQKLKRAFRGRRIILVKQDTDIFNQSIWYNVSFPDLDASDEEVMRALRAARLEAVFRNKKRFPLGIHTRIRKSQLSGGERQRIGIARALIALGVMSPKRNPKDARVLLLDEPTSQLDAITEKAIQKMFRTLIPKNNISIVVVAHRTPTVKSADCINVIEDGKKIEEGAHSQLMELGGRYRELVEKFLS